jgi:hypothetical protein
MMEQKPYYPSVLLVAGTGRNCGKTTLVSTICSQMKALNPPICIKISNHFHPQIGSFCHFSSPNFRIFEEKIGTSEKDSARMLRAGAKHSFFIEANGAYVNEAFLHLCTLITKDTPMICESGNLRHYIIPGKFILLHTKDTEPKPQALELIPLADHYWVSAQGEFQIPEDYVCYRKDTWELNNKYLK